MSYEELQRLEKEASQMENSLTKVVVLEQAIKLADSMGDLEKGVSIRLDLVRAAMQSGVDDRALVAFSWCLAQSDRDPDRFPENRFLWQYKWILGGIYGYPGISREKIHSMESDYEARLLRNGYGLKPLYKEQMNNAYNMGYLKRANTLRRKWKKAAAGGMSDCRACELDREVNTLVRHGEYERGIKKAQPLLEGRLSCTTVPERTFSDLVIAELSLGNVENAKEFFEEGYPKVEGDYNLIVTICSHFLYVIRVADTRIGLRLFERHIGWASETNYLYDRMIFFSRAGDFFERIASTKPAPRKVQIPTRLPIYREDNRYAPTELADFFHAEAASIASRYDARNGNNFVSWSLADARALAFELERIPYVEPKCEEV